MVFPNWGPGEEALRKISDCMSGAWQKARWYILAACSSADRVVCKLGLNNRTGFASAPRPPYGQPLGRNEGRARRAQPAAHGCSTGTGCGGPFRPEIGHFRPGNRHFRRVGRCVCVCPPCRVHVGRVSALPLCPLTGSGASVRLWQSGAAAMDDEPERTKRWEGGYERTW